MRLIPRALAVSLLVCVTPFEANALRCGQHPIALLDKSDPRWNQNVASILFRLTRSLKDGWFMVYGQYEKRKDLPLIHEVHRKERIERRKRNSPSKSAIGARITYTYFHAFNFSGVRIIEGHDEPFQTKATRLDIEVDGYALNSPPPQGKQIVSFMKETHPGRYDIRSGICEHFPDISEHQYQLFRKCLKQGGCPWDKDAASSSTAHK